LDDEVGDLAEAVGAIIEGAEGGVGGETFFFGHVAGTVEAVDGGEGDFLLGGVFAGGLAEFFGRLFDVEHVVDDLEG
jgi:hypothetical protein